MADQTIDDSTFETLASGLLDALMQALDDQIGDDADVDIQGGILTIDLDDGGQYVINKHGPNRQVWVSSPVSGAWHFDWRDGRWIEAREGKEMLGLLASELAAATDTDVSLSSLSDAAAR